MIFSVVVAVLNYVLPSGSHSHADAGYKLIAKSIRKDLVKTAFLIDRQIQTAAYEHLREGTFLEWKESWSR